MALHLKMCQYYEYFVEGKIYSLLNNYRKLAREITYLSIAEIERLLYSRYLV